MENNKIVLVLLGLLATAPLSAFAADEGSCGEPVHSCRPMSAEAVSEVYGYPSSAFQSEMVEVCFDALGDLCSISDVALIDARSAPNF